MLLDLLLSKFIQAVGAKQSVHWFLGGRVAVIQQRTNVWVGSPSPIEANGGKYAMNMGWERILLLRIYINLRTYCDFFVQRCNNTHVIHICVTA